jgi:hypothetical protein
MDIVRLNREQIDALLDMNLEWAVILTADVSVKVVGSVEAAFYNRFDANVLAERLNKAYNFEAFIVVNLRDVTAGEA